MKDNDLVERVLAGNRLALSRLITQIENGTDSYQDSLDQLFPSTGNAHIIGVTGPPGVGKSSLVNQLALTLQTQTPNASIGIIAVDPTSPFTGGALLGDRVRMRDLAGNPNIFIRSMATRGALGGIARAVDNAALAMDAAGFSPIIVETVGAGQSEVEIAKLAHTTIVVEAPGLGDDIQAAKAGILEIADILVVNKSDKTNAESTAAALEGMLVIGEDLQNKEAGTRWHVPVVKTSALNIVGIDILVGHIAAHVDFLHDSGSWERSNIQRLGIQVNLLLRDLLFERWEAEIDQNIYHDLLIQVLQQQ